MRRSPSPLRYFVCLAGLSLLPPATSLRSETLLEQAFALDEGVSRPRDAAAAARLYLAAVEQENDGYAHLRLGYLHEVGDGVPQSYDAARRHYEAAVAAGIGEARLRLALCHLEGWGGPVDREAFARELRLAAEADYVPAVRVLSAAYLSGVGVPPDKVEGVRWLERAARLNDPSSQHQLGVGAERRHGLSADVALARDWYKLSAEQEYLTAMRAMARSFMRPDAHEGDLEMARRWLELAGELGDTEAPYILGIASVLRPLGRWEGPEVARGLFRLASSRGNSRATEILELETSGRTLHAAVWFVLTMPFEERYMQRSARQAGDEPTRLPIVYRMIRPVYPQSLRLNGTTGEALVSFVVTSKGIVKDADVVSATHPLFGERAVEAVSQWRFHPGRKNGRIMNTRMQVPIFFSFTDETAKGVDALIDQAYARARDVGGEVLADAIEIGMAKPRGRMPMPRAADGESLPPDARALLLLVLDETGRVQRAHILEAKPAVVGTSLREIALESLFEPRILNGEPVPSNVLLPLGLLRGRIDSTSFAD